MRAHLNDGIKVVSYKGSNRECSPADASMLTALLSPAATLTMPHGRQQYGDEGQNSNDAPYVI